VRALGKVESKEAEQESLLLEFEVPYRPFGKAILDCLPVEGEKWVVPPKSATSPEWRGREDLRGLTVCSIDPPGKWKFTRMMYLVGQPFWIKGVKT
jgi:exosome complex exonuclease DIS3/RRP44